VLNTSCIVNTYVIETILFSLKKMQANFREILRILENIFLKNPDSKKCVSGRDNPGFETSRGVVLQATTDVGAFGRDQRFYGKTRVLHPLFPTMPGKRTTFPTAGNPPAGG
jgi:hypothetical protein